MSNPSHRPFYQKAWLSFEDQAALLETRGLFIADRPRAVQVLSHINYYRFSGYCLAFEANRHQFLPGTTFEQVEHAYLFDRSLRDVITEALEVIELDLRTLIAFTFGKTYGPFGHTLAPNFHCLQQRHQDWRGKLHEEARRSSELFVTHFKNHYAEFPDLPVWIVTEVMSFGGLSQMFSNMHRKDQKPVAVRYGLQPDTLESWMHHMVYVRNLCAHHSRIWDRVWSIKPTLPYGSAWKPPYVPSNSQLLATLLLLNHLLTRCPSNSAFASEWRARINELLAQPPACPQPLDRMGLTPKWPQHSLWK